MSQVSTIYSHRSLQPSSSRHSRLQESFDLIRQEVDSTTAELEKLRAQRDDYESKVNAQVHELTLMRRALYELEAQHLKLRQQYEEEISRLRSEMSHSRAARSASGGKRSPVDNMVLTLKSSSSDSRDNGRDRVHFDRERGAAPLLHTRLIDPERELDRLTDLRNPKRQRSRTNLEESSTFSPKHPEATTTTSTPPISLPPMGLSSPKLRHISPRPVQSDGTWNVMYNPKVPRLLDVSLLHTLTHGSVVCCVQFSPDGKHVATGSNRSARIYDIKTGQQKCCLIDDTVAATSGDLYIRSVRFSPDGKYLATGAEDRKIRVWDIAKKRICKTFEGHQQEIYSLDFSRDGKLIASGSGDRTARIWDLGDKPPRVFTITDATASNSSSSTTTTTITTSSNGHVDDIAAAAGGAREGGGGGSSGGGGLPDPGVTSVAISHDSRLVAAGSLDTIVRVWDIASGQLLARLQGHADSVYSVAFSADGRGLISGSLDKCLKYWDIGAIIQTLLRRQSPTTTAAGSSPSERPMSVPSTMNFVGHKDYVLTVAVSVDGNWVVSGSKDRCVHFWDAQNGNLQLSLQGHKNSVISLDLNVLNPTSGLLVTGSGDCQARIWSYSYRTH